MTQPRMAAPGGPPSCGCGGASTTTMIVRVEEGMIAGRVRVTMGARAKIGMGGSDEERKRDAESRSWTQPPRGRRTKGTMAQDPAASASLRSLSLRAREVGGAVGLLWRAVARGGGRRCSGASSAAASLASGKGGKGLRMHGRWTARAEERIDEGRGRGGPGRQECEMKERLEAESVREHLAKGV